MNAKEIQFIARNQNIGTSNILIYLENKREYVVCSNLIQTGNEYTWDWGHYFTDFETALQYLYREEITHYKDKIYANIIENFYKELDKVTKEIQHEPNMYYLDIIHKIYNAEDRIQTNIYKTIKEETE